MFLFIGVRKWSLSIFSFSMKKYILNIVVFIALSLIVNTAIQLLLLKDRVPILLEISNTLSNKNECIMFGSSVNKHVDSEDTDRRAISEMVDSLSDRYKVTTVSRLSASFENYFNYLDYSVRIGNVPKVVIVPVNIRSFNPEWALRPEYIALAAQEKIFLQYGKIAYVFRKILPRYSRELNKQSHQNFYEYKMFSENEYVGQVKEYVVEDRNLIFDTVKYQRDMFMINYMIDVDSSNHNLVALQRFNQLCSMNNISVLFYYTPVDFEEGERLYEIKFENRLNQQVSFLKGFTNSADTVIDLSLDLNSSYFSYDLSPNEHMNQYGKMYVAEKVSQALTHINSK